CARKEDSLDSW
nr:immunoglobulin heavy chain junction region [Macaca mulatta]